MLEITWSIKGGLHSLRLAKLEVRNRFVRRRSSDQISEKSSRSFKCTDSLHDASTLRRQIEKTPPIPGLIRDFFNFQEQIIEFGRSGDPSE